MYLVYNQFLLQTHRFFQVNSTELVIYLCVSITIVKNKVMIHFKFLSARRTPALLYTEDVSNFEFSYSYHLNQ